MAVPEIEGLVRQLWAPPDGLRAADAMPAPQVRVVRAGWHNPSAERLVESYAIVPSRARANFLVPLDTARSAAASLACYNELRSGRTRLARQAIAASMALQIGQHLFRDRLTVTVVNDVPDSRLPELLLLRNLAEALDHRELVAGIGVHPPDPNRKPTLQLFVPDTGQPAGYAKVGWNTATRRLVRNETTALQRLGKTYHAPSFSVPALLAAHEWQGRSIAVTEPLPRGVRAINFTLEPLLDPLRDIAGALHEMPLKSSKYWTRLRALADDYCKHEAAGVQARVLTEYLDSVECRSRDINIDFGRWHGDWVPWNIAYDSGRLWIWDWEHFAEDVPFGMDALHWIFQVSLVLHNEPVSIAAGRVLSMAPAVLSRLGLDREAADVIAATYVAEIFLRAFQFFRDRSGWNPSLYPGLLDVMRESAAVR